MIIIRKPCQRWGKRTHNTTSPQCKMVSGNPIGAQPRLSLRNVKEDKKYFCTVNVNSREIISTLSYSAHWQQASKISALCGALS